jgi:NADH-quinone oxidoreductase subunit H
LNTFDWGYVAVATAGLFGLFAFLATVVLSLTWFERKTLARIQMRAGPSRVGPHGLLQPLADVIKLVLKEDIQPANSSRLLFWSAPIIVFLSAFLVWVTIPFADGAVVQPQELGLLYIVAISTVGIVGLLLAGYTSASKYSVLGGVRAAAQLVSYEIPIIVIVLSIAVLVQSLDLRDVVLGNQVEIGGRMIEFSGQGRIPFAFIMPLGLCVFLLAGLAELGRTPFDIHHAESEVVGGPFLEYSGAHWAALFLAEYMNTFVIAALTVLLFFGGWAWPSPPESILGSTLDEWQTDALGVAWFMVKSYLVVGLFFWFRGTYPRLRIDQLMALGWKTLIPLSFVNLILASIVIFYDWPLWTMSLISLPLLAAVVYFGARRTRARANPGTVTMHRKEQRPDGGNTLVPETAMRR